MRTPLMALPMVIALFGLSSLTHAQDNEKPMLGDAGLDTAAQNPAIRPGDDFYIYVNGAWLDRASIPADKFAWTRRLEMTDRVEARLHEMMQSTAARAAHEPHDLEGKVGAFYKAFMNERRAEQLGSGPIAPELAAVRANKSRSTMAAAMGRNSYGLEATFFDVSIAADLKHSKRYAVYLSQDGIGLPDRDYYLQKEFSEQKAAYQAYVAHILQLINWPDADQRAQQIIELETRVAEASWTKVQDRDVDATYNPMTIPELAALAPGFDWRAFLASAHLSSTTHVIVGERTAFPKIAAAFAQAPVATLQAWQAFHIADNAAPYLSSSFADAWFGLHRKLLSGQEQQGERWKRAIAAISGDDLAANDRFGNFGTLGWAVGQLYTAQYFPPEAKAKVESLVRNLMASYHRRLETLDWMSAQTRAEAIKKLDTYTVKVGYPDHPRDYTSVVIRDDDLMGDVRHAAAADWAFYVDRLPSPVDRSDWSMTPQTNNAYNGLMRDIVFPAGILQSPIFDANADAAINYGAIGGVIGHELTHGFDDQGRKIDAGGELRDWWTAEDATNFKSRAVRLSEQYSAFQPLPNDASVHINGDLTLGENIADLGGLTLALDAYHASLDGQAAPVIDGLTGDQRVFMGWAQAWCGKVKDDFVRKQVVSDPHSPRIFRVNGVVRNIDAWYTVFGVAPGDKLYLAPEERVHIW
jgi:putative endopeptidase